MTYRLLSISFERHLLERHLFDLHPTGTECTLFELCQRKSVLVTSFALLTSILFGLDARSISVASEEVLWNQEPSWVFAPKDDAFSGDALLDLRFLNESQSGESGFVRLANDGNSLVYGNGRPLRIWAIGSEVYRSTPEEMDLHCRFLAKRGVNMIRLHTTVADNSEGAKITDVDEKVIDGIFRFIQAAKKNGIYLTISPYYAHHPTPKSWQLDGYSETGEKPWGALFIDARMQEAYRRWTRELYTRKNPYTGLAISEDPSIAILQIHNEDSVFFWTFDKIPEVQKRRLGKLFAKWLRQQYGSLEIATARWKEASNKLDNFEHSVVGLMGLWQMSLEQKGDRARRMRDEVRFLAELQRGFYAEMGDYLRNELKCRQLLNACNWRTAHDRGLKDVERWTYAALDIDAENEYYGQGYQHLGKNSHYRIDPGHTLVNESCLHNPLEMTTNYKQRIGHPFLVTETSWKNPNLYQTEGPFLVAAYQSLGGVDGVYWFDALETTWCIDPGRSFWPVGKSFAQYKWSWSTPSILGMFPAAALVYRKGYVQEGEEVVREVRELSDLWNRVPARIDDNEIEQLPKQKDRIAGAGKDGNAEIFPPQDAGEISRAAFLIGKVNWELKSEIGKPKLGKFGKRGRQFLVSGDSAFVGRSTKSIGSGTKTRVTDFTSCLDCQQGRITSNTGQLVWDYQLGVCKMDAPRCQGATGFLHAAGGIFETGDVVIRSENEYASISVVSMDEKPLSESKKILVQVGTMSRPTDWETRSTEFEYRDQKQHGLQIVQTGRPPWRVANTDVEITLSNPHITRATLLDIEGYAQETIAVRRRGTVVECQLPGNAMYVIFH